MTHPRVKSSECRHPFRYEKKGGKKQALMRCIDCGLEWTITFPPHLGAMA